MNKFLKTLLFFTLLISSSCSSIFSTEPETQEPVLNFNSIGLYLGRGSLAQSDFEQYKLVSKALMLECGIVKRGVNIPHSQRPVIVEDDDLYQVKKELSGLYKILNETKFKFNEAGTGRGMIDPGELVLTFSLSGKDYKIKTSVDSVSSPSTLVEIKLKRVVRAIRQAAGDAPCGLKDFYGLGNEIK